jgi:hypothetical protein
MLTGSHPMPALPHFMVGSMPQLPGLEPKALLRLEHDLYVSLRLASVGDSLWGMLPLVNPPCYNFQMILVDPC